MKNYPAVILAAICLVSCSGSRHGATALPDCPDSLRVIGENLHVQGIAYDAEADCFYGSFTTRFFKVDKNGQQIVSIVAENPPIERP